MTRFIAIAGALGLLAVAGCSTAQQTKVTGITAAVAPPVTTLLQVAADNSITVQKAVDEGALFCNSPKVGTAVAVVNVAGGIVSVVNATVGQDAEIASNTVATICQSIDSAAKPVVPPANPAAAPVVVSPTAPASAALTS